ncbi:MAG: radical SAM protein [Treponemataceae bacterium]
MIIKDTMMRKSIEQLLSYVHKDPEVNIGKAINMAKKLAPNAYVNQIKVIESIISDKNSPYYSFIFDNILKLQPEVLDKFIVNFLLKGNILTDKIRKEAKKKYNCNIPWTILVDPTTACNLKCKGCWAAEYGHSLNLSYEELDDLIKQAKEIGIYFFIFTGGEPLVRKNDIIKLCEKHSDCDFLAFTNATLIDDAFVQDMYATD